MFEFLSSPFGLVAVGLGVLAVAVLALCLWITTLDRRMRGMADGLEAERRKVAEMQMVIGRRNNAARSYGRRGGAMGVAPGTPGPAPAARGAVGAPGAPAVVAPAGAVAMPGPAGPLPGTAAPRAGVPGAPLPREAVAGMGAAAAVPGAGAPVQPGAPRPSRPPEAAAYPARQGRPAPGTAATRRRGGGWAPQQPNAAAEVAVDAWVQGGAGAPQGIVMPDKKMSRKARREAERAFAARAAAELEARQARRAQEVAVPRGPAPRGGAPAGSQPSPRPYGGPAAPVPAPRPGTPAPGAVPAAAPLGRGRHAR